MTGRSNLTDQDFAIQVSGLSKKYRIYNHPRDRLFQALWGRDRVGRHKQLFREFWALNELSFTLGRGQTLGVVGRNGSGKSTLLQLICGTLEPSSGTVQAQGRIGALLELGSGFNPEFSGLENVFLNASLLGLSRTETESKLDQILAFADIGDFVNQPVKTYSSGMVVRLAFAVQAHVNPEILIVDEALAVGDELFQRKCYSQLERLKDNGTSILLVSHNCLQINQHCDTALLLHKGRAWMLDEPSRVTTTYQRLINASDQDWEREFSSHDRKNNNLSSPSTHQQANLKNPYTTGNPSHYQPQHTGQPAGDTSQTGWFDTNLTPQSTEVFPSHGAEVQQAYFRLISGQVINVIKPGVDFEVVINYESSLPVNTLSLVCNLSNLTGQRVTGQSLSVATLGDQSEATGLWQENPYSFSACFGFAGRLWPGLYFLNCYISSKSKTGGRIAHRVSDFTALRVIEDSEVLAVGACDLQLRPAQIIPLVKPPEPAGT